jgi:hypothetical protein
MKASRVIRKPSSLPKLVRFAEKFSLQATSCQATPCLYPGLCVSYTLAFDPWGGFFPMSREVLF